jgi:UDP-N-acetylmuramoyl-tripeptide--D-alanyl-D-alanine ligase
LATLDDVRLTVAEIAAATNGVIDGEDVVVDGMSFDSRSLSSGQLFVPIVAERDGHDFLSAAIANGAAAYLTRGPRVVGATAIEVPDTLAALLAIAGSGRDRLSDRVVGITGSVGKTSCKDMTAAVLAMRWKTAASVKSYNNDQGLPHTILNAPDDTEALVLEMGMRGFGEIARLCAVGRPHIGVITAIAAAHTERVGGIEGVIRAKGELIESLPASGTAVLNADQSAVMTCATRGLATTLSFGHAGEVRIENLLLDERACAYFRLATPWGATDIHLTVPGAHMASNAAAAAAVGLLLDVPLGDIADALASMEMSPWRMEMHRLANGATLINDAYNANPASMRAALDTLAALPVERRFAVLGVMAEITDPEMEHFAIGRYAAERDVEVIAVGVPFYGPEPVDNPMAELAARNLGPADAVLVKGSRVAGLEQLAAALVAG